MWLSACLPLLQEEAENTKFALEQKIQELESRSSSSSSSYVSTPSSGQVRQTAAQQQLLLQQEERRQLAQQELQKQLAEQQQQAADVQKQNEEVLASRCAPYNILLATCMIIAWYYRNTCYHNVLTWCYTLCCTYAVKLCFQTSLTQGAICRVTKQKAKLPLVMVLLCTMGLSSLRHKTNMQMHHE